MYIADKNLPPRIPITTTLFWWMFLKYVNAPGWLFGIVGTIIAITTIHNIFRIFTEREVDVIQRTAKETHKKRT